MKIFLLEDDDAIGIGLIYSLKNEGYGVTLAKTVSEGMKMISENDFSLYILDLTLPDGNGYDFCKESFCNMKSRGIIDPTKVLRTAIENAVSMAITIITTSGIIAD